MTWGPRWLPFPPGEGWGRAKSAVPHEVAERDGKRQLFAIAERIAPEPIPEPGHDDRETEGVEQRQLVHQRAQ